LLLVVVEVVVMVRGSAGGGWWWWTYLYASYPVTPGGTITVTVGCGGNGAAASPDLAVSQGGPGSNSVFGSPSDPGLNTGDVLTALGGGGGNGPGGNGQPGGSGGGALRRS
jgi:hypothetical protein